MKKFINFVFTLLLFISFSKESLGQHKDQINTVKNLVEQFLVNEQIPGMSISVSKNGILIWSEGFGYMDIENKRKVDPSSTQFRIASISKMLTAVGLAILSDQEKLDFDASIYKYIPDFTKKKYDFTVRQVAGHLSGIRHYKKDEFLMNKKMSIVEGLTIFKNDPLLFEPGTEFKYSTYGWNLLSVVVQNAAQEDFNTYMTHAVFKPIGMHHTELGKSDMAMSNRTQFYVKKKGNVELGPKVSNEHKVAGGGFISTSEDLIRFGNEFIKPTILSKDAITELVKPQQTISGKTTNYGIGVGVVSLENNILRYSHSGGGVGATTFLLIYPEKEITIAILTNLSGVPLRKIVKELEGVFLN